MSQPLANLPNTIYQFAMSPYDNWHALAWAAALLITATVLTLNIIARMIGGKDHTR
jgi:phosphate transport system permease protein